MGPTAVEGKVPSRKRIVTSVMDVLRFQPKCSMAESPIYNGEPAILLQGLSATNLGTAKGSSFANSWTKDTGVEFP
jgi:hypothetical protein